MLWWALLGDTFLNTLEALFGHRVLGSLRSGRLGRALGSTSVRRCVCDRSEVGCFGMSSSEMECVGASVTELKCPGVIVGELECVGASPSE